MDQNAFAYTAYFKLFHPTGVQVSFGVGAMDAGEHKAQLDGYLATLMADGYSVQMPGLEPGEEIESVDAYVLGETSKGDPCLYLYSANHGLQWRIATVYVERFGDMPFDPAGAKVWQGDAAPARESAEKKGVLVSVPAFEIILEPTGKQTESGRPVLRYARLRNARPQPEPTQPPQSGNGHKPAGYTWSEDPKTVLFDKSRSFSGPDEAIAWGVAMGVFDGEDASNAYHALKSERKPATASAMWSLWIADVARRINEAQRQPA